MLKTLTIIFMIATMLMIVIGVLSMVKGGKISKKYSNKIMILRISFQATAIILLSILTFLHYA